MKYPGILIAVATLMFLVGAGIRMHADSKHMNKMYYHTIDSGLYKFEEVFAERKIGSSVQVLSIIAGVAGTVWFSIVAIRRK
jgi:hypothetical protein